jgi:hypothetical protein
MSKLTQSGRQVKLPEAARRQILPTARQISLAKNQGQSDYRNFIRLFLKKIMAWRRLPSKPAQTAPSRAEASQALKEFVAAGQLQLVHAASANRPLQIIHSNGRATQYSLSGRGVNEDKPLGQLPPITKQISKVPYSHIILNGPRASVRDLVNDTRRENQKSLLPIVPAAQMQPVLDMRYSAAFLKEITGAKRSRLAAEKSHAKSIVQKAHERMSGRGRPRTLERMFRFFGGGGKVTHQTLTKMGIVPTILESSSPNQASAEFDQTGMLESIEKSLFSGLLALMEESRT